MEQGVIALRGNVDDHLSASKVKLDKGESGAYERRESGLEEFQV